MEREEGLLKVLVLHGYNATNPIPTSIKKLAFKIKELVYKIILLLLIPNTGSKGWR